MVDQLSLDTVIIVACVCGSIVLILTVILIVLCCRRHETKYFYEKAETNIGRPVGAVSTSRPAVDSCSRPATSVNGSTSLLSLKPVKVDGDIAAITGSTPAVSGSVVEFDGDRSTPHVGRYQCTNTTAVGAGAAADNHCCSSPDFNDSGTAATHHHYYQQQRQDGSDVMTMTGDGTLPSSKQPPKKVIYEVIV